MTGSLGQVGKELIHVEVGLPSGIASVDGPILELQGKGTERWVHVLGKQRHLRWHADESITRDIERRCRRSYTSGCEEDR